MESVEMLLDLVTNHHSDVPIPGCLTHCINLEVLHCKICSEPFTNIHSFIRHGKKHAEEKNSTCSFCSEDFGNLIALSLHQLVWENKQEESGNEGGDVYSPRGCPPDSFPVENKSQLTTSPGCDNTELSVTKSRNGGVMVSSDVGDQHQICPRCGLKIPTVEPESLELHVVMDCKARSEAVARAVSRTVNMTDQSDLQAFDVLRMEIESVVSQFEDIQSGDAANLLDAGQMIDKKYDSLPDNFSRDFLLKVPERFSPNVSSKEFLQQFDVWSDYIESLAGPDDVQHIIAQYDDIVTRNSGDTLQWETETETEHLYNSANLPDNQLTSMLEAEICSLGGVSACPKDLEIIVKQLQQEMNL